MLVVMDQRSHNDRQISARTNKQRVGSSLALLKMMLGKNIPTFAALYDAGVTPDKHQRTQATDDYWALIQKLKPRVVIVLPTPSKSLRQNNVVQGTKCWRDLHPPDALDDMRGTFWEFQRGTYAVPMFWPYPGAGQLNLYFMQRWVKAAIAVAQLRTRPTVPNPTDYPCHAMVECLTDLAKGPVAVDIETIPNTDKVTAIGVANGTYCVSMPFDGFQPACGSAFSPPIDDWEWGKQCWQAMRELLASPHAKILQNGVFDLPVLRGRGFIVNGPMHDTLAMHAIAYPEARHGLQLACATEFICPPWKSLFKPAEVKRADPRYWYWDAESLFDYNARDAFYTFQLALNLAWKVGVEL